MGSTPIRYTMWKIRKIIKKGDYEYALVPEHPNATKNGYVLHHRIVMENSIGRLFQLLTKEEKQKRVSSCVVEIFKQ